MKRLTLILCLVLSIVSTVVASKKEVLLQYKRNAPDKENGKVHRAPERIPDISVIYDSEMCTIDVECDEPVEAAVFLYDANGNMLDYSPTVNALLSTNEATAFPLSIYIESESWSASAEIEP